ncbi:MAG: RluA family pseudouridine synthase [Lewinella sp.]|nr:RluA family pseudouridine synthase [Lewinella sp.]
MTMGRSGFTILYEDEELLFVDKPAGLLSIPDRFSDELPSLSQQLQRAYGEVWTVHRLDRDTSGVMCFALTAEAHRHLSLQFSEHSPEKHYLALTEGRLPMEAGQLNYALAPDPRRPGAMRVQDRGKAAVTDFHVMELFQQFTLVDVHLQTGRTHQIRVHFQAFGHPLVADPLYGRREAFYLSAVKGKGYQLGREKTERPLLTRTALHAASLALLHPQTGEMIRAEAPLPKDMGAVVQQLRKWNS